MTMMSRRMTSTPTAARRWSALVIAVLTASTTTLAATPASFPGTPPVPNFPGTPPLPGLTQPPPNGRGVSGVPPNPYTTSFPGFPWTTMGPHQFPTVNLLTVPVNNRSSASGSYLLTLPQVAIPGFNFTLGFESFVDEPYHLKARIFQRLWVRNGNGLSGSTMHDVERVSDYASFVRGSPGVINLPVPDNLERQGQYYWELSCLSPACPWKQTSTGSSPSIKGYLNVLADVTTIFVQTDKAIYKPGQEVHYRVFAVYPDLQMYDGNFTIEIKDPNQNKIQFRGNVMGDTGVVEGRLGLADQPVFGKWTIVVKIQTPTREDTFSKVFSVEEYQLPRFEVVVDLPSYALTTDSDLQGSVKATYTFGQPVKGRVELHVMSASARSDNCGNEPRHMELAFDIDGEAKFTVPKADISRVASIYNGAQIKVTASVKEDLTGVTLDGEGRVTFHSTPYKVHILDNTPGVFKPGLPFSVFAMGSMVDDSPVVGESNNTLAMYVTAHYTLPADNEFLFGTHDFTGTYPLPVQHVPLPASGVVKMDLNIPSNATRLYVTVVFKGLTAEKTINQMFSISDNYLQLTILDQDLKSGQTARVQASATEPMTELRYQILSRGVVYESNVIDAQGQHAMTFDVTLTSRIAPTAHMLAYYVRPDLEIVPDSIAFNVEGVFENEVTLDMSTNMSEPHTALQVTVTADPDSLVNLLAVDQSVLLMKTGNDVTPDEVSAAVGLYDRGDKPSDSTFALSLSQMSAKDTLQKAGILAYSDAAITQTSKARPLLPFDLSIYGPPVLSHISTTIPPFAHHGGGISGGGFPGMGTGGSFPQPGMTMAPGMMNPGFMTTIPPMMPTQMEGSQAGGQPLKEVERVRNLFPETWLWLNTTVGANGSSTISTTVPDTITSWITTAFATNAKTGLGVTHTANKLTVFRSFFVSLSMPSSVVRGEHLVIQASVFNYLSTDVSVVVSIPGSTDYTSIVIDADGSQSMINDDVTHTVVVKSQEQTAVYFPIIPTAVGAVDIEVSARSTAAADAVRRQLIVEAEGVPTDFSVPFFINLGQGGNDTFTQTFPISLPADVIDGSTRSRIKVTGDILGPSVDGLENLLRMPTGCGEQNMIKLAPDLYIANYLTASGQMTPSMQSRVKFLIETGYQRELTYQRTDGAFSAFGNRDGAGSTWLTAFVLRVFHEARSYVYVDDGVLQRALDWIVKRQNQDGSFNEFGNIFDPEMRHFKDHSTGLTSFVLISLLEIVDVPATEIQKNTLQWAIGNATSFLENHHGNITSDDFLSLALNTLALTKAGSPQASTLVNSLVSKSTTEHGMTFWKVPSTTTSRIDPYSRWRPTHVRARPIDIHVTSYALLVYSAVGSFQEGMNVLHWLTRQRNPYGGFSSTQDTVVGLQAMTEFVQRAVPSGFDLHVDVRADHSDARFDVTSTNALVLQAKDYKFVPSGVTFKATGKGVGVAELDVFFNVETDLGQPAFEVSTVLLDDYLNSFKVMICTRWLLPGESGMVIQEVGIPSGFAPDMTSVGNVAGIKRAEQKGRNLDIYFDKVTKNSLCYTVMFDRQSKVAHSQPSYVITQDYYEPSNRATTSYQSLSLKNSEVCDVCPDCCATP